MLRHLVCWLVILIAVSPLFIAGAQDDSTRINYNQTISDTLDGANYRDLYIFSGRQGEIISITMTTTDGDLDPYISLVDNAGRVVAFSDDEGSGNAAFLDSIHLPVTGDYFLIATRFGHEQGSTSGFYDLSLNRVGSTTAAGATIQYGDAIIGEINAENPQIVYVFQAERGDVINLKMERTSGNLDPFIDLANAQGQILFSGDDDPNDSGTLNAGIVNFTIPETNYYIVVATRYGRDSGQTQGSFLLKLDSIPTEERGFSPTTAILMDYGATAIGEINSEDPQRFYVFEGQRGDVVSVDMERSAGNLNVYVMILDSNLNELAQAGGTNPFNRARVVAVTLPQSGQYYVMATRDDFSEGQTAGEFELILEGRTGISGSNYLEIFYDTETSGAINNILPYESFVFQGEADDIVTIRMDATSGNLDPLLTLFQDTKQIAFDDDGGDNKNAAIIGFRLPADGIYRVEASRFNREQGNTEGNYVLKLEVR